MDRSRHILRSAETSIGVDNRGNLYSFGNVTGQLSHFREREQTNVRHACGCVRHPGAADINRVETDFLNLSRRRRVWHARHQDGALRDQFTQSSSFAFHFDISKAFINSSTFFASSTFHTRSTIRPARFWPIDGSTSAKNFPSTWESFSGFFACPSG